MNEENKADKEQFRDTLGIVSKEGKRKWIFPKKPKGRFHSARAVVSAILLLFFFGTPFIRQNGQPFFLFNILERKFILFGSVFGPHDFFILLIATLSIVVFIVLFTVVYGRVFCGWICPQTVFMEMVFRKIEYIIEGDALKQRALKVAPWTAEKFIKKFSKHLIFFAISFIIANTFLAWVIGTDKLFAVITESPSMHLTELFATTLFSLIFYIVFSWFREQACILVCPYGRLQSVLLDQTSIVIAYDYLRGEPRGRIRKHENQSWMGDCIDCGQCVEVCPTGIDIRNGTQLECINCTACIDVCNFIMKKVKLPQGLIRFASSNGIEERTGFKLTPRVVGYSIVLVILITLLTVMTLNRTQVDISILRTPGLLSQEQPEERISNLYDVRIHNKTFNPMPLQLKLKVPDGEIKFAGSPLTNPAQTISESKFLIILRRKNIRGMVTPVIVEVYSGGKKIDEIKTTFLGKAGQ
ncbi:MAG: cytochrome c oxidase accessory protein CcoG [Ignavibacteria bacterium]